MRVCVDTEGNGATMNEGGEGGTARLAGDKISSQLGNHRLRKAAKKYPKMYLSERVSP